ncbi:MAG TPA: hypothetical protein VF609_05320, partial [Flavisolibacter sp.]
MKRKKYMISNMMLSFCFLAGIGAAAQDVKAYKRTIGVKAGLNFYSMTALKSFNAQNNTGFVAGGYFSPSSSGGFGFRS